MVDGDIYCRLPNGVALRCISDDEGRGLLADIHVAGKAFRSGFYWLTALTDAMELVKSCKACQFHAKQIHQPAQQLQTIQLSWPFAV